MYCPSCRDEFRPGFTHCGRCNVDLVDTLGPAVAGPPAGVSRPVTPSPVRLIDYCGFFTLDEAQHARCVLRDEGIRCEIVLREPADADLNAPPQDEFWLRIDAARLVEAQALLELDVAAASADAGKSNGESDDDDDEDVACGACGHTVSSSAASCPKCGAEFDED